MLSEILILITLILLNAFFASSEIALISLNDNKIRLMAKEGNKTAKILANLLSEPSRFLATIQIGITLAGFLASAFASESFTERLLVELEPFNLPISDILLKNICVLIITMILSYFTLVFGELVPKRIAMRKYEVIAMFVARPLATLLKITLPFVKFLTFSTNILVRLLGINPNEKDESITEEEIRMMVDVGEEEGTIHETEKVMINNIFEFNNKIVADSMTHRTDMETLPINASLNEVLTFIKEKKYSRTPVYDETIDNIVGILYSKDIIKTLNEFGQMTNFDLKTILREAYHVPSSKRIDELFKEFQKSKNHVAIVLDEYGGTAGLVSLEDLLEEIVGNIFDEDDEIEYGIKKINENTYIANGMTNLEEISSHLDINLPLEEFDTLSGFIIGKLGSIPSKIEKPVMSYLGYEFMVLEADSKRISKVKISKTNEIFLKSSLENKSNESEKS